MFPETALRLLQTQVYGGTIRTSNCWFWFYRSQNQRHCFIQNTDNLRLLSVWICGFSTLNRKGMGTANVDGIKSSGNVVYYGICSQINLSKTGIKHSPELGLNRPPRSRWDWICPKLFPCQIKLRTKPYKLLNVKKNLLSVPDFLFYSLLLLINVTN